MNAEQQQREKTIRVLSNMILLLSWTGAGGTVLVLLAILSSALGWPDPNPEHWFRRPAPAVTGTVTAENTGPAQPEETFWTAPDTAALSAAPNADLIRYGRDLVANTARYLGQRGSVRALTNGMNCQNCHLDAGTRVWGNNYGAVASTYPKMRPRSGKMEDISKRINDCMERSLNGKPLDTLSREMQAIRAYIAWLGQSVPKGTTPNGSGIFALAYPDRAADTARGRIVYVRQCQSCHQPDGGGLKTADGIAYQYPPLWGKASYNTGAGLYRISRLAGYVRYNMPLGATYRNPQVSEEDAWDVAAFINSMPRPSRDLRGDWPDIAKKPVDHPFGPYADGFSEVRHKYGPFAEIEAARKAANNPQKK